LRGNAVCELCGVSDNSTESICALSLRVKPLSILANTKRRLRVIRLPITVWQLTRSPLLMSSVPIRIRCRLPANMQGAGGSGAQVAPARSGEAPLMLGQDADVVRYGRPRRRSARRRVAPRELRQGIGDSGAGMERTPGPLVASGNTQRRRSPVFQSGRGG
jgi:hypothetical protein